MSRRIYLGILTGAFLMTAGIAGAQGRGGGAEWPTAGGDAQRTSWIRNDAAISVDALAKGGFDVQWKTKVDERARQNQTFGQGIAVSGVALFWPLSVVTGVSNNVYAFDNDTGNVFWQKHLNAPLTGAGTASCPGGMTGAATKMATLAPAAPTPPRAGGAGGGGRGGYQSLVGEPGEGAPTLQRAGGPGAAGGAGGGAGRAGAPAAPGAVVGREGAPAAGAPPAGASPAGAAPAAGAPQRAGGGGGGGGGFGGGGAAPEIIPGMPAGVPAAMGGGFGRVAGVAYVIGSDGKLYTVSLFTGKEMQPPAQFVPANAKFSDPIAVNNILYVTTSGKCGGAADGVWAMDLAAEGKPVVSSKPDVGAPIGAVAFTPGGALIAATATSVVSLDPKTLERKDWYAAAAGTEIASAPMIFKHGDKDIVAVAAKDGRILMLDAASLGGANHTTPFAVSQPVPGVTALNAPSSLAMWYELSGTKWLLVPAGKVTALKIADQGGKPALQTGWASREIGSAVTPIVVNGVMFALSRGGAATPATLYAMDGATGKELYNSGRAMTSPATGRSFWSGAGQVYVGTADGTVYAFGFAMERK